MSRVFSLPTALRVLPGAMLRRLFDKLGHPQLVDWDALGKRDRAPLVSALGDLEGPQLDRIEAVLHTLFDLGCDTGLAAIRESEEWLAAGPAADVPDDATPFQHAVTSWIDSPDVIDRAVRVHQVENLTWWRKRRDLPARPADLGDEALAAFGRDLSALLVAAEGRGRQCTVERMTRKGTEYVFAHPDDFAHQVTAHDRDGHLVPRTVRQTFPIVFAFHAADRTLETFAKVPYRTKPQVEALFARRLLGVPELPRWPKRPTYQLDHLKVRTAAPQTEPADRVRVEVRQMRFRYLNSRRQLTFEGDPGHPWDTYALLDDALNQERVPLSALDLTMVRLEFAFADGREPGDVTLDVSLPGNCNLRNLPPHRADVIQKYLRTWGVDAEGPADGDLAAAG